MIVDGINLDTFLAIVNDRSPSRSAARTAQLISGAPGAWRRRRLGRDVPNDFPITLKGAVVGDTLQEMRDNIDQLKWTFRPDHELQIRWSDYSDRQWLGYRETLRVDDIVPGWVTDAVKFNLLVRCPDPFAQAQVAQNNQTSGSAPRDLTPAIGTAPMPVIITIVGNTGAPLVNPVIHYRNGADADVITLSIADTLDSTETVIIDTEFFTAKKNGSNIGDLIAGSYFDINPNDGDFLGSPNGPDVLVTADSGTLDDFQLDYRRRWW